HLAQALLDDLACLERDQRAERVLLAPKLLAEQADELAAVRRGHVAPGLERGGRAGDLAVGGGGVVALQPGDRLAGDGRAHLEVAGVVGLEVEAAQQRVARRVGGVQHARSLGRKGDVAAYRRPSSWHSRSSASALMPKPCAPSGVASTGS